MAPLAPLATPLPAVPPTDSEPDDNDDDVRDPDYVPPSQHGLSVQLTCERLHCSDEIFAACQSCLRVFCYEHFTETCTFCSSRNITLPKTADTKRPAEEYEVEGEARESLSSSMDEPVKKKSRRQVVKECRRLGKEFRSEVIKSCQKPQCRQA